MGLLDDFYEERLRFKNSSDALKEKLEERSNALVAIQRLKGATSDFVAASERFSEGFRGYLPWSIEDALDTSQERASFPLPSEDQMDFMAKAQLDYSALSDDDKSIFNELNAQLQRNLEAAKGRWARQESIGTLGLRHTAWSALVADTKSFTLFCRAYQDAAYAALLEGKGLKSGGYSSMSKGLKNAEKKESGLNGIIIALPTYAEWFQRLRTFRDLTKLGAIAERSGVGFQAAVILQHVKIGEKPYVSIGDQRFGFADGVDAMAMSAKLTHAIVEAIG